MHAITPDTIWLVIGAVILAVTTEGFRTQPYELTVDSADSDQPGSVAKA